MSLSLSREREFCETMVEFLEIDIGSKICNKIKFGKYKLIKPDDPILDSKCSICLEDFDTGKYKRKLKCGHTFHKKCVDRWFRLLSQDDKDLSCPICRFKLV